jgi:hypothetical protein
MKKRKRKKKERKKRKKKERKKEQKAFPLSTAKDGKKWPTSMSDLFI